jgi:CBS domain-containing protein
MVSVAEIMTKEVACCTPRETVEHAADLMKRENVGPIPVVEDHESKRLLGIVTDRDLAIKVVAEGRDARTTEIQEVMTPNPVACGEDEDIEHAMALMSDHQVRRLPVVDDNQCLIGIVAQADIARRLGKAKKTGAVVEKISEP